MASDVLGALYTGVTSNLLKRIHEHRTHAVDGFTKCYHITRLVYFEIHESMDAAIHREKRLKKYTRLQKIKLIAQNNPKWNDLWDHIS